jgi:hypothetical protein
MDFKAAIFKKDGEYLIRLKNGDYFRFKIDEHETLFLFVKYQHEKGVRESIISNDAFVERQTKEGYLINDVVEIGKVLELITDHITKSYLSIEEEAKDIVIPSREIERKEHVSVLIKKNKKEEAKDLFSE